MNQLWFWKSWSKYEQNLLKGMMVLTILSLILFLYILTQGSEPNITQQVIGKLSKVSVPFYSTQIGPVSLNSPVSALVVFQYFDFSSFEFNPVFFYIHLSFLGLAIALGATLISCIEGFWYYIAVGLFVVFLMLMNLQELFLFESTENYTLIISLSCLLPLTYFFSAFKQDTPISHRFILFSVVIISIGVLILFYSGINDPMLNLATGSLPACVMVVVLLSFIVAHEVFAGFLFIVSNANFGKGYPVLINFLAISLFYLASIVLAYLVNVGIIDWDIYYFNEFFILTVSVILGFWGLKNQAEQGTPIIPFKPVGAIFYLTLTLLTFSTLSLVFINSNDPFIEVFEDTIVFSQLGFGAIFLIYVIGNFSDVIFAGAQVSKVLYKPIRMPYFTARFGGLILVLVLYYVNNQTPFYQAIAGLDNAKADLLSYQNERQTAEFYYRNSAQLAAYNHHANYSLGKLYQSEDYFESKTFYEDALVKHPSVPAYINLANLFRSRGRFFESVFVLQEGLSVFPNNRQLLNNLGFVYSESNFKDSAAYFFERSRAAADYQNVAGSNQLALNVWNKEEPVVSEDPRDLTTSANAMAKTLTAARLAPVDLTNFTVDFSTPDLGHMAFIRNAVLTGSWDYKESDRLLDSIKRQYPWTTDYILYSQSLQAILKGEMAKGVSTLNNLIQASKYNQEYPMLLGNIYLNYGYYELAAEYFTSALTLSGDTTANLILANALAGKTDTAQELIQATTNSGQSENNEILEILSLSLANRSLDYPLNLDDPERFVWLLCWKNELDKNALITVLDSFIEDTYTVEAVLGLLKDQKVRMKYSNVLLEYLTNTKNVNKNLQNRALTTWCLYNLDNPENISRLMHQINNETDLELEKQVKFLELWLRWKNGDSGLRDEFLRFASENPFLETIIVSSAAYLAVEDELVRYNILLDALKVNKASVRLLDELIRSSIRLNLDASKKYAIDQLTEKISPEYLKELQQDYDSLSNIYSNFPVEPEAID
jgi:hypothetical protein